MPVDVPPQAYIPQVEQVEEVTVTARYRSESLQDAPLAITALDAPELAARGISDVTGLTGAAPSTTLVKEGSTGGNTLVAYIRGTGQGERRTRETSRWAARGAAPERGRA
jgi:outer membrane receptor protein involved in Fe transport